MLIISRKERCVLSFISCVGWRDDKLFSLIRLFFPNGQLFAWRIPLKKKKKKKKSIEKTLQDKSG